MAVSLSLFLLLCFVHRQPQNLALAATRTGHDFRYMKFVHNATDFPATEEYDYIVIGGGTAGCPLAATLSENFSVLVLERGNVPTAYPTVLNASGFLSNLRQDDDGNTPAQRFVSEDGVANLRGRVLGGSSRINLGFYSRADEEFFSKSGVEWDLSAVKSAYEWVEEALVSRSPLAVWQSAVKEALLEAGVVPDNGFTLNHELGTKESGSIFDEVGLRHGADELLSRGNAKNLRVAVHATVERIIFSTKQSSISATGVIYTDSNGKSHQAFVRHKGEVILSAGTIGSPQLLLLSGIGPNHNLSSLNIPIIYHQPNVGKFMFDNPRNAITLIIPFPIELSYIQVVGITSDYFIESISFVQPCSPTPSPFSLFPTPLSVANLSLGDITEKIPGPLSEGSLWLSLPANVKSNPLVRFNYFADPRDLSRCVSGMRKIAEMLNTKSMERFKYNDYKGASGFMFYGPSLPMNLSDDSQMEEFCRNTVSTIYHYHGGCLVGKVVDGDFRVLGIKALRVVDASTFALTPGTNPQATIMMLGRYVGHKILGKRRQA